MPNYLQNDPPHPGKTLEDLYFEPLGLTLTEAAEKLIISVSNLSAVFHRKAGISTLMALKLTKDLDTTLQYWTDLQTSYDL